MYYCCNFTLSRHGGAVQVETENTPLNRSPRVVVAIAETRSVQRGLNWYQLAPRSTGKIRLRAGLHPERRDPHILPATSSARIFNPDFLN
jgi:hypothetical protein